ncbi:MAG: hypothetical protein WD556_06220 [Actinomycetota bacterium]
MRDCSWTRLSEDLAEDLRKIQRRVESERAQGYVVYPPEAEVFRAVELTPCHETKVVIVGQDPYHGAKDGRSQADGLCFSVRAGLPIPPSLRNIRGELRADQPRVRIPDHGSLEAWAGGGVLLINAESHADLAQPLLLRRRVGEPSRKSAMC